MLKAVFKTAFSFFMQFSNPLNSHWRTQYADGFAKWVSTSKSARAVGWHILCRAKTALNYWQSISEINI